MNLCEAHRTTLYDVIHQREMTFAKKTEMSTRAEFVTNCHTGFDDGWALIETLFESIVMRDEMKSCNVVAHCNGSLIKNVTRYCALKSSA